ncbi:multi-sensor hybrid histidine kinase [Pedosphaera parvula Ellin514]|uniref:histidine kinase n=2 Tax=Pedosphaera TaxID=1032526 RepID=B9XRK6_PEDPL|nr:multi-sensor hybrid histidine kinase [Pedosphaera parvula Ellin514]
MLKENFECAITHVKTQREFEAALKTGRFELILSDYSLPAFDGLSALALVRKECPETPFIFVSGTVGEEQAVESLKLGATDYVIKDRPGRLVPAIRRALDEVAAAKKRQQAGELLREQARLLDQAQDAICLHGLDHSILYWNQSAERLYGWSAQEALNRNVNELLSHDALATSSTASKTLLEKGEWQGELHQVTKKGRKITVESRWTLMRDQQGDPTSILIINTDVTGRKQFEAQLLRTQRMETIGALAGGIAHDLNNALTPVVMALSFIQGELATGESKKMLNLAQSSTRRSVEMVKQILSFARSMGGEHASLQIRHLIAEIVELASHTFPRSIHILSDVASELYPVTGNATQLHQVLLNLCVNARDAMPDGGSLTIEATNVFLDETHLGGPHPTPGSHVLITVRDTGHGMSAAVLDRIFDPFFTTKEIGKGTGLSLSTVKGIVKTHGGFVEASSELGKGSVFKIYLPAATPPITATVAKTPSSVRMGHGEKILLIDDESTLLEVTKLLLESCNYKVLTAKHGGEGVALYERNKADIKVVVTDMMMPIMNGPETIRALRQIDPSVQIIGMSGLGSESALAQAVQLDVRAFLKKPFATEDLLETLHQLISQQTWEPPDSLASPSPPAK